MRYVFNKATIWAWDIVVQIGGFMVIMGAGYTLLHKGHVAMDFIVTSCSFRVQKIIDLFTGLLFFFAVIVLLWTSVQFGWRAFEVKAGVGSYWNPPIYPLKMTMPIGIFLLLLQGLAKFIRDLDSVIHGKEDREKKLP